MKTQLSIFGNYFRAGLTIEESFNLTRDHLGDVRDLEYVLSMGVNPCGVTKYKGRTWVECVNLAVNAEIKKRERDRVHNRAVAVGKEKVVEGVEMRAEYIEPWKVNGTPATIGRIRAALEHVHDKEVKKRQKKIEKEGLGIDLAISKEILLAQANAVRNGGNQVYAP